MTPALAEPASRAYDRGMNFFRFAAFLSLAALAPMPALAWGAVGHRTIATIAYAEASPATRKAIRALLKHGKELDTPTCKLKTIEDAAVWPDCIKGLGTRFAFMGAWHYQDISVCHGFDFAEGCKDDKCVTRQIAVQAALLKDTGLPTADRVKALALLVHFVGDMHQPLHVGEKADRGGNSVRVEYLGTGGAQMNLHRIWDSELAEAAVRQKPKLGRRSVTPAQREQWRAAGDGPDAVVAWARESWAASREIVYGKLVGYPNSCEVPAAPTGLTPAEEAVANAIGQVAASTLGPVAVVDQSYVDAAVPVVRERIEAAGVRLGMLLDDTMSPVER